MFKQYRTTPLISLLRYKKGDDHLSSHKKFKFNIIINNDKNSIKKLEQPASTIHGFKKFLVRLMMLHLVQKKLHPIGWIHGTQ